MYCTHYYYCSTWRALLSVIILEDLLRSCYCGASHRRHCTLLPLRGGTATQALLSVYYVLLHHFVDMLLLSLCTRVHSATCSPGTCGLWPLILIHSYLSTTHSLLSQRSAFCILCVLGRVRLRAWVLCPIHNESTCGWWHSRSSSTRS